MRRSREQSLRHPPSAIRRQLWSANINALMLRWLSLLLECSVKRFPSDRSKSMLDSRK